MKNILPYVAKVTPVVLGLAFLPLGLDSLLSERPYESPLMRLADKIDNSDNVYKKELDLTQMQNEVRAFQSGKVITRARWIPAGDAIVRTRKEVLDSFVNGEEALKFITNSIPSEKPANPEENVLYARGRYTSTLRKVGKNYWLHITAPSEFWATWDEVDILGRRN
ncbi:MAG: hypothetical protein AABX88_01620 [Nanoarchaeota archaeon]